VFSRLLASCSLLRILQNSRFVTHKWSFFFALFFIGLINNNGYVMVGAGAATLADDFNRQKLMPMFQL